MKKLHPFAVLLFIFVMTNSYDLFGMLRNFNDHIDSENKPINDEQSDENFGMVRSKPLNIFDYDNKDNGFEVLKGQEAEEDLNIEDDSGSDDELGGFITVTVNKKNPFNFLINKKSSNDSKIKVKPALKTGPAPFLSEYLIGFDELDDNGYSADYEEELDEALDEDTKEIIMLTKKGNDFGLSLFNTPLNKAIEIGRTKVSKYLLDKYIMERDSNNLTSCHYAALFRNNDMLEILLSNPAAELIMNRREIISENTPLHFAAIKNYEGAVMLIEKGESINLEGNRASVNAQNKFQKTPLRIAIENKNDELAKFLLQKEYVDIRLGDIHNTLLHVAAINGNPEIVTLLLKRGADVNAKDKLGNTPLFYSLSKNNQEVSDILIERGGNIERSKDINELNRVIKFSRNIQKIESIMAEPGFDINGLDENGWTPLLCAVDSNSVEIVNLLIANGADVNKPYKNLENGVRPIHFATFDNKLEIVQVLAMTQNVNYTFDCDYDYQYLVIKGTPIHIAASKGFIDLVNYFLDVGVDPNIISAVDDDSTPLHSAVKVFTRFDNPKFSSIISSKKEIIKSLIDHGAKVSIRDKYCRVPVNYTLNEDLKEALVPETSKKIKYSSWW